MIQLTIMSRGKITFTKVFAMFCDALEWTIVQFPVVELVRGDQSLVFKAGENPVNIIIGRVR
jgi:hypothetical protein